MNAKVKMEKIKRRPLLASSIAAGVIVGGLALGVTVSSSAHADTTGKYGSYSVEQAEVSGGVWLTKCDSDQNCAPYGTKATAFRYEAGSNQPGEISWSGSNAITVPSDGWYDINIRYMNMSGSTLQAEIVTRGTDWQRVYFPAQQQPGDVLYENARVWLQAGSNNVVLRNALDANGPEIVSIAVS